jgi:hypothetical protein
MSRAQSWYEEGTPILPGGKWQTRGEDGLFADDATGEEDFYEYEILIEFEGKLWVQTLGGASASHAYDEAWHEYDGNILAVRRGVRD